MDGQRNLERTWKVREKSGNLKINSYGRQSSENLFKRVKVTWKQLTERDRREWKLSAIDPHDRDTWRSGVRSAMRAARQLPGRGPTVVDMAPVPAR